MCVCQKQSILKFVCFSNSVCEVLILKLQNPSIIIFIIYRLPLCLDCDFIDVIVTLIVTLIPVNSYPYEY